MVDSSRTSAEWAMALRVVKSTCDTLSQEGFDPTSTTGARDRQRSRGITERGNNSVSWVS